jgi:hypothetical protein
VTASRSRILALAVVASVTITATVAFIVLGPGRDAPGARSAAEAADAPSVGSTPAGPPATEVLASSHVVFRSTALDQTYGQVAVVSLDDLGGPRVGLPLSCDRVFATHGSGICLTSDRGVATTYDVQLLGPGLLPVTRLPVAGIPSRARVSSDGRWAAATMFVTGHSYAADNFSTATEIYDMAEGRSLGNLETFSFERGGKPYSAVDINVWGVTFAPDSRRFYATVATGGGTFLAEGDVRARTITISDESAECPSLSPDATRIAYKKRINQTTWRIHVRDLASGADVALAETRSVDDQLEWWDDEHVVYGLQREGSAETDVWTVLADGSGSPELLIEHAWSPAIVR